MVSAASLRTAAKAEHPTLDELGELLRNAASEQTLKEWATTRKINVWHGTVSAGEMVYTPAGYLVASASCNQTSVSSLRKCILPVSPGVVDRLTAVRESSSLPATSEAAVVLLINALSTKHRRLVG